MSDIINSIFKNRKMNLSKLEDFGFVKNDRCYNYRRILSESGFELTVSIAEQGKVSSKIIDTDLDEEYTLHLSDGAVGSFVGEVRREYEEIITQIAGRCFDMDVFKSVQTGKLIDYVKNTYGDEPEYLWSKFPGHAVLRRKDTGKWYGALLTVFKRKLGIPSDEEVEIIDLRVLPEELEATVDNKTYFPGYHMNKKHWLTIILDGSVADEEIFRRIDKSYILAVK